MNRTAPAFALIALIALIALSALAGCDNAAAPAGPAAGQNAPKPAAGLPATIDQITGTWIVDLEASRTLLNSEMKVALIAQGQTLSDEQFKMLVDQVIDAYTRAEIETTVSADKTYAISANGQRSRGTILLDGETFVFVPDNNAGVSRYTLSDGKLVSQRPADLTNYRSFVAKRK
jgi:hypothetical protein